MNNSKILFVVLLSVLVIIVAAIAIVYKSVSTKEYDYERANTYIERIIEATSEKNNEVNLNEIFDFSFDRAYVFNDPYISGTGFTKRYDLKLSIDQVESGDYENIRRIVFVDEKGNLIYEFRYNISKLYSKDEGIIVYSATKIRQCPTDIEGSVGIEFLDVKESDFY